MNGKLPYPVFDVSEDDFSPRRYDNTASSLSKLGEPYYASFSLAAYMSITCH